MSKELDEKRRKLAFLEKVIPDNEELLKIELKNLDILSQTVSIEEAHEMYLRGDATKEEYENYVRDRGALEVCVRWLPKHSADLDTMKQEAAKLKAEIAKIERDCEREEKRKRRAEFIKKIFGR